MKILAVEFSTGQRSVAVAVDGQVRGNAMEAATRATPAFGLIEKALSEARVEREEIECLAVGLGPGSFTGIRGALALAQGWQLARPVKLLGIASTECIAAEAQVKEWLGPVSIVIDAQRGELYVARYEINAGNYWEIAGLKLATPEQVKAQCGPDEIIAGPDANRWFEQGRVLFPNAATLARLASTRTDFVPGEKLEPLYLRETSFVKAPAPRVLPTM